MKLICTFVIYITAQSCIAQKILVPYRSGKLFGLSDEKGKLILRPGYDNIDWMTGRWFRASKKIELKDTLETAPGKFYIRNTTAIITSLINNNKLVLTDEPFDQYEIVAGKCIVTEYQERRTNLTKEQHKKYGNRKKLYGFYNLEGKSLYPEGFRRIQKMDTAGMSTKHKNEARYILFWAVNFDDKHSLLVFDADKQEISEWLVKDAYKISPQSRGGCKQIIFSVTGNDMNRTAQLVDYSGKKFVLQPITDSGYDKASQRRRENTEVQEVSMGGSGSGNSPGDVEVPPYEDRPSRPAPRFNSYYSYIKDSLFYITSYENRRPVKLPVGCKVILLEPSGMTQYQPVMIREDKRFYIVDGEQPGTMRYDSLIYFGKYFLAWRTINGQMKAGVINADGSTVIPFKYDSLYAGIRYFDLTDLNPAGKTHQYQIVFREADTKYSNSKVNPYSRSFDNLLTVFANGKAGAITMKREIVIPFNYQMIARNKMNHMKPREDEFIILKQNGRYGITTLKYNAEKKYSEMDSSAVAPSFEYIPGFYYANYFGINKYKLVGLYDEQLNFMGYATETGKVFYDNQQD